MSEISTLGELFEQAATLASRVPAAMQAIAFQIAFESLAGGSAKRGSSAGPPEPRTPSRSTPKARNAAGRPGPKAAVESLVASGYLDAPRLVGDIRDHLAGRGWKYVPKEIATAVLRLLREGVLSRSKGADGQYRYERAT